MTNNYRNRLASQNPIEERTILMSGPGYEGHVRIADIQLTMMYQALKLHPMKLTRSQPPALAWWKQVFDLKGNKEKLKVQALKIMQERFPGRYQDGN
tara:strand:- start:328 stop:618 length:291 start_codon:yes stop_codon:yes gene_type:complete